MRNAQIAFVSAQIGSLVNMTLPVVSVLARRGHRVTYAVSDPYCSRVEAVGAEIIKFRFGAITSKLLEQDKTSYCQLALNTVAAVTRHYSERKPDLLIYDFVALAGPILAKMWNVPAARVTGSYAFSKSTFDRQIKDDAYRTRILEASGRADQFLESHGIAGSNFIFHRERLNIYPFPRDFEPCDSAVDSTCWHAGRCPGEQLGFGEWRRPNVGDKPVVLIAPSTSYLQGMDYFTTCIAAFSNSDWHIVLCVNDDLDVSVLGDLPKNFEIVQRTSYTRILPHVDLVVCTGGTATTSEAAYYGVPMVITSVGMGELELLGDNLIRLDIGVHLKGTHLDAETLRAAAKHALESASIQRGVNELMRRVRREAGAEETANRIEDYIEENNR